MTTISFLQPRNLIRLGGLLWWITMAAATSAAEPDYLALAHARVSSFFLGELAQREFSISSAWRRNFNPVNLADKAPLQIASLEILEIRLPDNPTGFEAIFTVSVNLPAPSHLDSGVLAAGKYTFAGSMSFFHTTTGYLVRDCNFTIIDTRGEVAGGDYLPWKTAVDVAPKRDP
jgi:hypothetical protein